jgi:hypothetical protein
MHQGLLIDYTRVSESPGKASPPMPGQIAISWGWPVLADSSRCPKPIERLNVFDLRDRLQFRHNEQTANEAY